MSVLTSTKDYVSHQWQCVCDQWDTFKQRMQETYKERRKKEGGFTLVELMVVVAVIAILAALAMPQFLTAANKAKEAKVKSDVATISNAAQLFMMEKSRDTVPTVEELYKSGYLSENVKTPKGTDYTIAKENNDGGEGYHIKVTANE